MTALLIVGSVLLLASCTTPTPGFSPEVKITSGPWTTPPAGYSPQPTLIDSGLAYGTPCRPPCWEGLIPGKTTEVEGQQILQQLLADGRADEILEQDGVFMVVSNTSDLAAGLFDDNLLRWIYGDVKFAYTIGDLIATFGPPEGISVHPMLAGGKRCSSCAEWDPPITVDIISAHLAYPEQGLSFILFIPDHVKGCICPEMRIRAFCYYTPQSMEAFLATPPSMCASALYARTPADLIQWHGFGGGY